VRCWRRASRSPSRTSRWRYSTTNSIILILLQVGGLARPSITPAGGARQDSRRGALDCRWRSLPRASRPSASRRRPCATRTRGASELEGDKRRSKSASELFVRGRDSASSSNCRSFGVQHIHCTATLHIVSDCEKRADPSVTPCTLYAVSWVHCSGCQAAVYVWLHCVAIAYDI
jgi:hypothetical protein